MIVLKMLGHLGKLATLPKTEETGALVDVDDALATHAEGKAAVFVNNSIASHYQFPAP